MANQMTLQDFMKRYPHDPHQIFKRGGQGVIFKGRDAQTGAEVAIKRSSSNIHQYKYSIIREFELGKTLQHPNLAKYIEAFQVSTNLGKFDYGVMEFIEGGINLDDFLRTFPTEEELKSVLIGVLRGMNYLHRNGVIHRDLKPSNILIKYENNIPTPKIIDFGISKDLDASETTSSDMVGTVEYMSPEQLGAGKEGVVYPNTDIWAFGVILYKMYAGESPFGSEDDGLTREQVINKIYRQPLPRKIDREVPEPYRTLIKKCLTKDPKQRIQSVDQVIQILEEKPQLSQKPKKKKVKRVKKKRRLSAIWVIIGIILFGVVAGLSFILLSQQKVKSDIEEAETNLFTSNYQEAFDLLEPLSEDRYFTPYGNYLLGKLYFEGGDEIEVDYIKSDDYLTIAADNDFGEAMLQLAYLNELEDFRGVDTTKAGDWYRKAKSSLETSASRNRITAQSAIGDFYSLKNPIEKPNISKAIKGYRNAGEKGYSYAQARLGEIYMDPEFGPIDTSESNRWYKFAANKNDPKGTYGWGLTYETGFGVPRNQAEAYKWFLKSANRENPEAEYKVGLYHYKGYGDLSVDYEEANTWFERAANQGNGMAAYFLGEIYEKGRGVEKDYSKSFSWYEKGARRGNPSSQNQLGFFYMKGYGTSYNPREAIYWFRKSAKQNHKTGQYNLGFLFETGMGTSTSLDSAYYWYNQANLNGYSEAPSALERLRRKMELE